MYGGMKDLTANIVINTVHLIQCTVILYRHINNMIKTTVTKTCIRIYFHSILCNY